MAGVTGRSGVGVPGSSAGVGTPPVGASGAGAGAKVSGDAGADGMPVAARAETDGIEPEAYAGAGRMSAADECIRADVWMAVAETKARIAAHATRA